jgi:hypothetical protein
VTRSLVSGQLSPSVKVYQWKGPEHKTWERSLKIEYNFLAPVYFYRKRMGTGSENQGLPIFEAIMTRLPGKVASLPAHFGGEGK